MVLVICNASMDKNGKNSQTRYQNVHKYLKNGHLESISVNFFYKPMNDSRDLHNKKIKNKRKRKKKPCHMPEGENARFKKLNL